MPSTAWLILPTYNEAENVGRVVRAALEQLETCVEQPHILIVDDGSPDGTGRLADDLAVELDGVSVLHRAGKEGLGRAYVAGFTQALRHAPDFVLQMDADLSHDPAYLPQLVREAQAGADLVLGSRYVPGGGVGDWGPVRRVISRGGCEYARRVLGLRVRDLTGGMKCWRGSALAGIGLETVAAEGYAFQIETTYRATLAGSTVVELPIVFRDRAVGTSKMSARIAAEALWRVPQLRLRRAELQAQVRRTPARVATSSPLA